MSRAQPLLSARPTATRTGFYRDNFRRFIFDNREFRDSFRDLIDANCLMIHNIYKTYLFLLVKDFSKFLIFAIYYETGLIDEHYY